MATFVLVHGAFHGGWCWKKIRPLLIAAGHEVYTPTLTGLGDRAHLLSPAVNLSTHIMDIANLLYFEDLSDVLLIGHSYGGLVIEGVAESASARLKHLVYLDAVIPNDGQSLFDTELIDDPEMRVRWTAGAIDVGGVMAFPGSPKVVEQYLAAWEITNSGDITWMTQRLRPHPLASVEEGLNTPMRRAEQLPASFINCIGSSDSPESLSSHAKVARARGLGYYEMLTGHDAMVTAPHELVAILLKIAG